mmetsp:Transcript_2161/g.3211  ORF Transcript_2161/g.3211 Transcript_2161/m.3211 type:complete len:451 (+) Transcript_2161:150-1502(+)|eukprot:CAMPEP_0194212604 /NCGR_PEP_ID=MMETSP0156-20130528/12659_1 /TAXON_ID=33649 /ORGANISM="Thalassionema nitzschioides, Strain L26-B" /LENGTH=450 /DNA_ID=CAMNT_0038940475 /DNA_START=55 /DNA_END=1404 /DNA_ORIENTATION=-
MSALSQSPSDSPPFPDTQNTAVITDNTESSVASKTSGGIEGDTSVAAVFQAIGTKEENDINAESEDTSNQADDDEHPDDNEDSDSDAQFGTRGVSSIAESDDDEESDIEYPFRNPPRSLRDVADFIRSDECQSIMILAGAGMSVASGIPDFRSVGGLYDTLNPSLLTATDVEREAIRVDPTAALEMGMFLQNPLPCLELNRPFILGTRDKKWKATLAHRFVELLHAKTGKLTRLYQQNIDGLESQCTGLPREKIVMVHGSMDEANCAICGNKTDFKSFCSKVEGNIKDLTGQDPKAPTNSTPLTCDVCGSDAVKPSIVLFRSPLPKEFFQRVPEDIPHVDLLIIIGTSLAVAPANTLVFRSPQTAMRVVVNREPVGFGLGIDYSSYSKRDYFAGGDIDRMILELIQELGWLDDIEKFSDQLPDASARVLREVVTQTNSKEQIPKRPKLDK